MSSPPLQRSKIQILIPTSGPVSLSGTGRTTSDAGSTNVGGLADIDSGSMPVGIFRSQDGSSCCDCEPTDVSTMKDIRYTMDRTSSEVRYNSKSTFKKGFRSSNGHMSKRLGQRRRRIRFSCRDFKVWESEDVADFTSYTPFRGYHNKNLRQIPLQLRSRSTGK